MGKDSPKPSELHAKLMLTGAIGGLGLIFGPLVVGIVLGILFNPTVGIYAAILVFIIASVLFYMKLIPLYKQMWTMGDEFHARVMDQKSPKKQLKK